MQALFACLLTAKHGFGPVLYRQLRSRYNLTLLIFFKHISEVTSTNQARKMNHGHKCFIKAKRKWNYIKEELKALFKSIPNPTSS